jgi:hypothetical protein
VFLREASGIWLDPGPFMVINEAKAPVVHTAHIKTIKAAITGNLRYGILLICIVTTTFLEKQSIKGSFAPAAGSAPV